MGKVVLDVAMSLDGFIAGRSDQPERLHDWMFPASGEVDPRSAEVIAEGIHSIGAIIMGRRTYDDAVRNDGFADTPYDAAHFVLTHEPPTEPPTGNVTLVFVTDGIESALAQAQAAAGARDVVIGGGANIAQQFLRAGLVDEIKIDLVSVLLGEGTRLFDLVGTQRIELECTQTIAATGVTHLRYRVAK